MDKVQKHNSFNTVIIPSTFENTIK